MKSQRETVFDILPIISKGDAGWGDGKRNLLCPVCEGTYNHIEKPSYQDGRDDYAAHWDGRGDLIIIPLWGECGSKWELCVGFHKGESSVFARVISACSKTGSTPPMPSV